MHEKLCHEVAQSIIQGEDNLAAELARQSIAQGMDPLDAISKGFVFGVDHIGNEFSCGNAFLLKLVMADVTKFKYRTHYSASTPDKPSKI